MKLFAKKLRNGFTLTELLTVTAIIAVLAGGLIAIADPISQFQKAQDARRKSDLSQIRKAVETYYDDFRKYPEANTTTSNYRIKADAATTLDWGSSTGWQYMQTLPKDPSASQNYIYYSPADRQSYYLYASLERGAKDSQVCKSDGSRCDGVPAGPPAASCGTGKICNYGVSSPNVSP